MSHSHLGMGGERRYSVPSNPLMQDPRGMHSEDLHAWSIYRQNLNSDFTDSALGSTDKSPLPYGNFQLRDTTVQSILSHPRYGPKSALGSNMYTYLKFGLPRVFPPNHNGSQRSGTPKPETSAMKSGSRHQRLSRGMRETSSGYDSSDNETTTNYKYSRKYRSDPDFRMQNLHPSYQPGVSGGVPLVAMQAAGVQQWGARHKSVSEANLLGVESRPRHHAARRASVVDYVPDGDGHSYLMAPSHLGGRMSKAGSHMSNSRKLSTLRPTDHVDGYAHSPHLYPNYYVNNLEVSGGGSDGGDGGGGGGGGGVARLGLAVRGSELAGVLAADTRDATALLDVLAGHKKKVTGDIIINGQPVASTTLRKIVAYVQKEADLCPHMTVEHTLRYHATLTRPNNSYSQIKMGSKDRINLLIEELGLEQVRDTYVGRLTKSEVRRLNVACQLLSDMSILILDQPTQDMDIFDTFFLVEYLTNWASSGRIVIMSLHPPTYEIFAMLTKVLLISAGRVMFSGYRRDMLPYFASIDYPCPAYKNPSDYYLDLVTLDGLSAAAALESSSRIAALAEEFSRTPPPPPPPPAPLPPPRRQASPIRHLAALLEKTLLFTQMNTLSNLITSIIIAGFMSLVMGAIFWDLPITDAQLSQHDRVGLHYAASCLCAWPVWTRTAAAAAADRRRLQRARLRRPSTRTLLVLYHQFTSLWSAALTWLAYLVPSYAMSGLYAQAPASFDGFYTYLGYMLLYLISIQMLFRAAIFIIPHEKTATAVAGLFLLLMTLANGVMLNLQELPQYLAWLEYISPSRWLMPELLQRELSELALKTSISKDLRCINKQKTYQDIIIQSTCPPPNGTEALATYGYVRGSRPWEAAPETSLLALAIFYALFALLAIFAFVCNCTDYATRKERRRAKGHKVTVNTP